LSNFADSKWNVLTDKTNRTAVRRSRRNAANPQANLGSGQKSCIYKVANTAESQDLPPEERLALYTFDSDENDPPAKKSRRKRNVRRRIKGDMSDAMDVEYIPTTDVSKCLKRGTRIVTRQKKHVNTDVTKMTLESEVAAPVVGSTLHCLNTPASHHENLTLLKQGTVSETCSSVKCLSPGVACCDSDGRRRTATENKENIVVVVVDSSSKCQVDSAHHDEDENLATENKAVISVAADRRTTVHQKRSSVKCLSPGVARCDYDRRRQTATEKENIAVADSSSTCQVASTNHDEHENLATENKVVISEAADRRETVHQKCSSVKCLSPGVARRDSDRRRQTATEKEDVAVEDSSSTCQLASAHHDEHENLATENKAVISEAADRRATVHQKLSICTNLADDSELNFSVGESEPGQVSSSSRSSFFISPVVRRFSQCVTMRRPGKSKHSCGIQSVEDFTIDNCFGFDEESEDDLDFSLSEVKVASSVKPVMSVSFAVSSTPYPKPSFTRPEIRPVRLVRAQARTRTARSNVKSATLPAAASASGPKLFVPDTTPPDTIEATHSSCPSICPDEDLPAPHFTKVSCRQSAGFPHWGQPNIQSGAAL
jgi:hypothetical protein